VHDCCAKSEAEAAGGGGRGRGTVASELLVFCQDGSPVLSDYMAWYAKQDRAIPDTKEISDAPPCVLRLIERATTVDRSRRSFVFSIRRKIGISFALPVGEPGQFQGAVGLVCDALTHDHNLALEKPIPGTGTSTWAEQVLAAVRYTTKCVLALHQHGSLTTIALTMFGADAAKNVGVLWKIIGASLYVWMRTTAKAKDQIDSVAQLFSAELRQFAEHYFSAVLCWLLAATLEERAGALFYTPGHDDPPLCLWGANCKGAFYKKSRLRDDCVACGLAVVPHHAEAEEEEEEEKKKKKKEGEEEEAPLLRSVLDKYLASPVRVGIYSAPAVAGRVVVLPE
jgi:hypothetical protein